MLLDVIDRLSRRQDRATTTVVARATGRFMALEWVHSSSRRARLNAASARPMPHGRQWGVEPLDMVWRGRSILNLREHPMTRKLVHQAIRPRSEQAKMAWITVVALAVGAGAALLQVSSDNDTVLTGVIATATVAYAGFTWRLVQSAEDERADRRRSEGAARRNVWLAVLSELEQDEHRKGQTHAYHTHVPFERSALDAARHLRRELPHDLVLILHEVESRIARYNAVSRYNELQVRAGSGAADKELNRLADEVHISVAGAVERFRPWVQSLPS